MTSTFVRRAVQGFLITSAILTLLTLFGVPALSTVWPPNRLTREQYAFCTNEDMHVFGGAGFVHEVAHDFLGVKLSHQEGDIAPYQDRRWAAACRYAYVILGVSGPQSTWCADGVNRPTVAQAVGLLGAEGDGPGTYTPPGDSEMEYVQACRLAYDFMRQQPAPQITPSSAAFALTPAEESFCSAADPHEIGAALTKVSLAPPSPASDVELAAARAVGCRLSFIQANFDRGGY